MRGLILFYRQPIRMTIRQLKQWVWLRGIWHVGNLFFFTSRTVHRAYSLTTTVAWNYVFHFVITATSHKRTIHVHCHLKLFVHFPQFSRSNSTSSLQFDICKSLSDSLENYSFRSVFYGSFISHGK